ncbi:MAG: beta-ketoacyl-ACP synthase III [Bacteroidales bacterium]|nr:beta-ketoacyl-ACP synthase III [Bacteroidales bacterium]
MSQEVYINIMSRFLPNNPISNDEMEDYLGKIHGVKSKAKSLILRNNGIKTRYYAIDKNQKSTHTNSELSLEAIKKLNINIDQLELLSLGTTSADQTLPSHAAMVHGLVGGQALEVISPQGSCNSGMLALRYAYLSIKSGEISNAIAGGSEKLSTWMLSDRFEEEAAKLMELKNRPYIAFEREFLRWMLSDGAAVAYLENKPNKNSLSLKLEWVDIKSFANELETCMYSGCVKNEDGSITPWRDFDNATISKESIMALQQDTRVLSNNIVEYGAKGLKYVCDKYHFSTDKLDYFLPHMSSEFFRQKIEDLAAEVGCPIPQTKWFTNLTKFGNVGAASAYLMLEELFNSGLLKKGQKILIMSPESARFSYAYALFTVV